MIRRGKLLGSIAATGTLSLVLSACGGDDGDQGATDFVLAHTPRCTKTTHVDSELLNTQVALTRLHELIELASISPEEENQTAEQEIKGFDVAGPCGGWVYFTPTEGEEPLATDYDLDLQAYCIDSPEGDMYFTGQVSSTELAKVTEEGTLISELHTNFDNLEGRQGDEIFRVSMTGGRTVYGKPTTERPLSPTRSSPDKVTINKVKVNHESAGITDKVSDLEGKRWDVTTGEAFAIQAGEYLHGESGDRYQLSSVTAPLVVDPETGEWLDGVLNLNSASNPLVQIKPAEKTGDYLMVVPGNQVGGNDCEVIDKLSSER